MLLIADADTLGAAGVVETLKPLLHGRHRERLMLMDRERPTVMGGSTDRDRLRRLDALMRLTSDVEVPLIVNHRVDLALAVGAPGVQLPEHGLSCELIRRHFPHLWVGRSCHDRMGLRTAEVEGADWALLSPVSDPLSKKRERPPLGIQGFSNLIAGTRLPTFGLGGIRPADVPALRRAGAQGVALIGHVFGAEDPRAALDAVLCLC